MTRVALVSWISGAVLGMGAMLFGFGRGASDSGLAMTGVAAVVVGILGIVATVALIRREKSSP